MSWIEEIDVTEADGNLAEIYAKLTSKRGKVANILQVHSLNPEAMSNHADLYMTLMFGKSGLRRAEREAIASVPSWSEVAPPRIVVVKESPLLSPKILQNASEFGP